MWPRASKRPSLDAFSAAVAHLHRWGVTAPAEVARALHVERGTVRTAESGTARRDHPHLERGLPFLDVPPVEELDDALRRRTGRDRHGRPPLPRVYVDPEQPPPLTYFNPLLAHVAPGESPGAHYIRAAERYLHELWAAGDPRVR